VKGKIILSISIYLLASCRKPPYICNDGGRNTNVSIRYLDHRGQSLFMDSSILYPLDSIRLYDLQNSDSTSGFPLYFDTAADFLYLVNNSLFINNYSVALIHLRTGMDDTLKCHYSGIPNAQCDLVDSVWYNGILSAVKTDSPIVIVK